MLLDKLNEYNINDAKGIIDDLNTDDLSQVCHVVFELVRAKII